MALAILLLLLVLVPVLVAGVYVVRGRAVGNGRDGAHHRPGGIGHDQSYDPSPGVRYAHLWGYEDTRFEFCSPRIVQVTGSRYPLAGHELPRFIPYVEQLLDVAVGPDLVEKAAAIPALPAPVRNEPFLTEIEAVFSASQVEAGDEPRLIHSHGQLSVDEIYRILRGRIPKRVVDLVVYPESEQQVLELVRAAERHDVVLIPYGGGTNVSGALKCPDDERRMIVSVDMQRMSRILELNRENNWVIVEAGITGKELERLLNEQGLTGGHIPDSIELSTLGGWIATYASGMKKNRYGNIEDIVLEAVLITPRGEVRSMPLNPRCSIGVQARGLPFGSEGSLGIITRAVLAVRPLPRVRRYGSFVFPQFDAGVRFLRAVQESGMRPASLRLTNNTEFRLGHAVTPRSTWWQSVIGRLKRYYLLRIKGFDIERMVAATAVIEGTAAEVRQQRRVLARLSREAGGLSGGSEGGRRGYQVTFAIAYIRDFLNTLGILGETFETSAPWDRIGPITSAVERELAELGRAHGVSGRPYLSYRISQIYPAGVCIYFTMGFCGRGLEQPDRTYQRIEHRLREVVLEQGGSLSHHHGVGKIRQPFIHRAHSPGAIRALRAMKAAMDPANVFAAANNVFGPEQDSATHPPPPPPVHTEAEQAANPALGGRS